jgi:hypothetical protein
MARIISHLKMPETRSIFGKTTLKNH